MRKGAVKQKAVKLFPKRFGITDAKSELRDAWGNPAKIEGILQKFPMFRIRGGWSEIEKSAWKRQSILWSAKINSAKPNELAALKAAIGSNRHPLRKQFLKLIDGKAGSAKAA